MKFNVNVPVCVSSITIPPNEVANSSVVLVKSKAEIATIPAEDCPVVLKVFGREGDEVFANAEYRHDGKRFLRRTGMPVGDIEKLFSRPFVRFGDFVHYSSWLENTLEKLGVKEYPTSIHKRLENPTGLMSEWLRDSLNYRIPHWDSELVYECLERYNEALSKTVAIDGELWAECPEPVILVRIDGRRGEMRVFSEPLVENPETAETYHARDWKAFWVANIEEARKASDFLWEQEAELAIHDHGPGYTPRDYRRKLDIDVKRPELFSGLRKTIHSERQVEPIEPARRPLATVNFLSRPPAVPKRKEPPIIVERTADPVSEEVVVVVEPADSDLSVGEALPVLIEPSSAPEPPVESEVAATMEAVVEAVPGTYLPPTTDDTPPLEFEEMEQPPELVDLDLVDASLGTTPVFRVEIPEALRDGVLSDAILFPPDPDLAKLAAARQSAEGHALRRIALLEMLYHGRPVFDVLADTEYSIPQAMELAALYREEGVEGLMSARSVSLRDLPPGVNHYAITRLVNELPAGANRNRLEAMAAIYRGSAVAEVAKEVGVSMATMRSWIETFGLVDKFAFMPDLENKVGNSLQWLSVRKLLSPVHMAKKFDAVSLIVQGETPAYVIDAVGTDRAQLKSWLLTYKTYGPKELSPDTVIPKSLVRVLGAADKAPPEGSLDSVWTRRRREGKKAARHTPIRVSDFDERIIRFAEENSAPKLFKAAATAKGPLEAAIFKSLADKAQGKGGRCIASCVSTEEYRAAVIKLQDGGIPAVQEWIRATGLEMPWPAELRELARRKDNHPSSGKLKSIAAHLEGMSRVDAAEMNWMSPNWFSLTYGNFKRFGMESHMVFGIDVRGQNHISVPVKPSMSSPMRRRQQAGAFRNSLSASNYISHVFDVYIEASVERIANLVVHSVDSEQKEKLKALRELMSAPTVEDVDRIARRKGMKGIVKAYAEYGPEGLLSDRSLLAEYRLHRRERDVVTSMISKKTYRHRAVACAVLDIMDGAYPFEAAHENDTNLEKVAEMVRDFEAFAADFRTSFPALNDINESNLAKTSAPGMRM